MNVSQIVARVLAEMRKIDADADYLVDKAESVNDGTYSKSAQQISEHLDSTSDPHSTIPSQTGNSGKVLGTNGSVTSWVTSSGGSTPITPLSFTNSDLSSGVLTYTHSLGSKYVNVIVWDNTDKIIIPDEVTGTSTSVATIDLSSYGTISGTWHCLAFVSGIAGGDTNFNWLIKTANYTLVVGDAIFSDSSTSALTHTLPSNPVLGDKVIIKDYKNNASIYNITIGRNGKNIDGTAQDFVLDVDGSGVLLVYSDSTSGWEVINYG